MGNERDVFEWRRFGHWATSARKARLAAFGLWRMRDGTLLADAVKEIGYAGGDEELAIMEAFRRESAVALELVIKAVIANRLIAARADPATAGLPATHDIPDLWAQARLPKLESDDRRRLLIFKSILMWSGRYSTPRTVEAWEKENAEFDKLDDPPVAPNQFVIRKHLPMGWPEFDRLYQMAAAQL
jgi:hypothetical protein